MLAAQSFVMPPLSHPLTSHPGTSAQTGHQVVVTTAWLANGNLRLGFCLANVAQLRWPDPAPARHTDGLWQHTCCEAFIAPKNGTNYREFNFSPSGAWAIYDFTAYREGSAAAMPAEGPTITQSPLPDGQHLLQADIPAHLLPSGTPLQVGLTTVLEHADGSKSYWALRHAGPQPDFHLRDSFCLNLARP